MHSLPKGIKEHLSAQYSINKRVLWIAGTYFPDLGGAEWSLMGNACLMKNNYGQLILVHKEHGNRVIDGIPVLECNLNSPSEILRFIRRFDPGVVATQGLYARPVIEQCLNLEVHVVYFLRAKTQLDFSNYLKNEFFTVVANSKWMTGWFKQKWGISPCLLNPVVLPWVVTKESPRKPEYITHVGDADVKGGGRVLKIAKELSNERFLVTRSWPAFRNNEKWREDRIGQLKNGDGAKSNFEPVLADFNGAPNVRLEWPFLDPSALYRQTKILLVASKWREPYGRVVIEGLLNGLPVIVSPEVQNDIWSDLVYHVNNPEDPKEWSSVICKVLRTGIEKYRRIAIDEFCSRFNNNDSVRVLENEIFNI
jgi:glycosyltransferase involved in cell wall biosynthesis